MVVVVVMGVYRWVFCVVDCDVRVKAGLGDVCLFIWLN